MPLPPIPMIPAFRHGTDTPWGGRELARLYHKPIPDDTTGEALEVSAIPGHESRDPEGRTLTELIALYGDRLVGTDITGPFPLLLKLLDARDRLSVQVHPNDDFAREHEGKLGKTEAWIILYAKPHAKLIYGIKPGVDKDTLDQAARQGAQVEDCLRQVPVRAGDVLYIPAGTVHAIMEGIVLYEIQQSSDVTYRFYDWQRPGKDGKLRELHLDKALAVTDVSSAPDMAVAHPMPLLAEAGSRSRLLDTPYFTVDRLDRVLGAQIAPDRRRFGILTAVSPALVRASDRSFPMEAGWSLLLPADGEAIKVTGDSVLVTYPQV